MREGSADRIIAGLNRSAQESVTGGARWLSPDGAFEDASLFGIVGQPMVVDANWIRSDLIRSFQDRRPTILLNATNRGAIRLYAAPHVLDEVVEHHEEWVSKKELPASQVLEWWRRHYLPAIRLVDPPAGLLDRDEQQRMETLGQVDPDDVPSATLALLLQAPFISSDGPATKAVYGPTAVRRKQDALLELLRKSSNDNALRQSTTVTAFVPVSLGSVLIPAVGRSAARHPVAAVGIGALLAALGSRVEPATWRRTAAGLGSVLAWVADVVELQQQLQQHVQEATPPAPAWDAIGGSVPAAAVRTRAVMHTMAHRLSGQTTVDELVGALPPLPVATGPRSLGEALREHIGPVFQRFGSAVWQLGQTTSSPNHRRPRVVDAEGQCGDI